MKFIQLNIYFVSFISFLLSIIGNYFALRFKNFFYQQKREIIEKRLVSNFIPPIGGVATALSFLISVNFLGTSEKTIIVIGIFGTLISIIGVIDDFYNLNWKSKLFFQILFVSIPVINIKTYLNIESLLKLHMHNKLNLIVTIFWIVFVINIINFIDNMDGLAVVVSSSILLQITLLTYYFNQNRLTDLSIVLLFSILGFFVFNFPPAKLYLGDSGSLFIGFCLGFLSILFVWNPGGVNSLLFNLSPIFLFFTIPLLDFLVIFNHRIKNNIKPTTGGTDHISHRLLKKGLSEKKVLLIFVIYSFISFILVLAILLIKPVVSILFIILYLIHIRLLYSYLIKLDTFS